MATAEEIAERVKSIIVEQLGVSMEEVTPAASFIEDLGADSLDIVELIMALEEEYDMEIPDEDAENIRTVDDDTSYITNKQAKITRFFRIKRLLLAPHRLYGRVSSF